MNFIAVHYPSSKPCLNDLCKFSMTNVVDGSNNFSLQLNRSRVILILNHERVSKSYDISFKCDGDAFTPDTKMTIDGKCCTAIQAMRIMNLKSNNLMSELYPPMYHNEKALDLKPLPLILAAQDSDYTGLYNYWEIFALITLYVMILLFEKLHRTLSLPSDEFVQPLHRIIPEIPHTMNDDPQNDIIPLHSDFKDSSSSSLNKVSNVSFDDHTQVIHDYHHPYSILSHLWTHTSTTTTPPLDNTEDREYDRYSSPQSTHSPMCTRCISEDDGTFGIDDNDDYYTMHSDAHDIVLKAISTIPDPYSNDEEWDAFFRNIYEQPIPESTSTKPTLTPTSYTNDIAFQSPLPTSRDGGGVTSGTNISNTTTTTIATATTTDSRTSLNAVSPDREYVTRFSLQYDENENEYEDEFSTLKLSSSSSPTTYEDPGGQQSVNTATTDDSHSNTQYKQDRRHLKTVAEDDDNYEMINHHNSITP